MCLQPVSPVSAWTQDEALAVRDGSDGVRGSRPSGSTVWLRGCPKLGVRLEVELQRVGSGDEFACQLLQGAGSRRQQQD